MNEQEFWKKYLASKYFHRNRGTVAPITLGNDIFAKYVQEKEGIVVLYFNYIFL